MTNCYSTLVAQLRERIDEPHVDIPEITRLIRQSFETVSANPTETSRRLHNCLLAMLVKKHAFVGGQGSLEIYYFPPQEVKDLERQFDLDPSDFLVVFRLAVAYADLGKHARARQLLHRVAHSGYSEKSMAIAFLNERYGEEFCI